MPLTKSKGNMYPWVTHTHTHLAGECSHKCSYCYVDELIPKRFRKGPDRSGRPACYKGPLRMRPEELRRKYDRAALERDGGTYPGVIFIDHCNDLWAHDVPASWIAEVLEHCWRWPENAYVFQTKNPARYRKWVEYMPPRRLLGCTIETTDTTVAASVSRAPTPFSRYDEMRQLTDNGEPVFITIEPIMYGDMLRLAEWCQRIQPEFVNIGADSKGHGLWEPSAADVRLLIEKLTEYGVPIREKRNLGRLLGETPKRAPVARVFGNTEWKPQEATPS